MLGVPVVIPLTLLALGLGVLSCLARPRWDVAVLTGLLCAIWARVNGRVEGRILHTFSQSRGFTEADLVSVAGLLVVLTALVRCALRSAHRPPAPAGAPRAGAGHQGP
ncbi:hypothetical protein [Kineococcus gypseus]|uniref:hypothetical protein n=1 Tax=Kineococcus gypseus TaxID=1637102 RepID=UPI003D7C8142